MAEAVVSYVLGKLADALHEKAMELHHVSGQIKQMQLELRLIQASLRDAHSRRNRDALIKEWVDQVRDIAYRMEDVIDTWFQVEIEENHKKVSENGLLPSWYSIPSWFRIPSWVHNKNKLKTRTFLGGELEEITHEFKKIYQLRTDLRIMDLDAGSEKNHQLIFRRAEPSDNVDDLEVVGLEDDTRQIMNQLLDRNISRRTVLSIVGTGGLGKTTLAQKVYKSVKFLENVGWTPFFHQQKEGQHKAEFNGVGSERQFDYRIWITVSQKYNFNDLMRKILLSVIGPRRRHHDPTVKNDEWSLRYKVMQSLRTKRYLIILDDVWTTHLWEELKEVLPDCHNYSRVIITTRSLDVAIAADRNTKPYKLRFLNDNESVALLFRKAFQQHIQPQNYPSDLSEVTQRLIRKCGGLPLALIVLGGILTRREPTYCAWNTLEETMDWHNEDGEQCSKVLAMSYEDLPYHLKPCFLYFASFPEDYQISGKHVKRMWMAEGFIPNRGVGTIEDRAEEFLQELVQRCLIQVTEKYFNGYCKYFSMHDLLQNLAIHEAEEDKFFTITAFSKVEDGNQLAARKPRRVALQFCTLTKNVVGSKTTRSLLCFAENTSNDSGFRLLNYSGFRLLRVLTIEGVNLREFSCREWLKDLIHLRYLGFRYCIIGQKIFQKNSLYNLETIDLEGTCIDRTWHPNEWNQPDETTDWSNVVIPTLRHVYGNLNLEQICTLKWDHLTNLQTLKSVGQGEVPKLGCSTQNLRTLGIHYGKYPDGGPRLSPPEEWHTLEGMLQRMEQLVSLSIVSSEGSEFLLPFKNDGTKDLPCHQKIQSLHLHGIWNDIVPSVEMFPTNLTKLTLVRSCLKEDPMPIFERLQSLRVIQLGVKSYKGTKLTCSSGGFSNLKKLELKCLPRLGHLDIKEGAMPILRHLKIKQCCALHTVPELQKVRTLQMLKVSWVSHELAQRLKGEDLYKIEHIPSVRVSRIGKGIWRGVHKNECKKRKSHNHR